MGMTIEDCIKMLIAKEKCMKRETSGIDTDCNSHNCNNCSLCYEQGTIGEQKMALLFAVDAMRQYQKVERIISAPIRVEDSDIRYKAICEVVENGKID